MPRPLRHASWIPYGGHEGEIMSQPSLIVIQGARAFDPGRSLDDIVDVVIESGTITRVGAGASAGLIGAPAARVIQAEGRWLFPGLVEVHAHLREPGFEYKEDIATGLAAAAAGGYAHVCAMPNTRPANDSPETTAFMIDRARSLAGPRLHPIAAITHGLQGDRLTDMVALRAAGAVAFSDDGRCLMSGELLRQALLKARELGVPIIQHAEDHTMTSGSTMHDGCVSQRLGQPGWPREAEDCIVARDLEIAAATGGHYHLAHASTRGSVRLIRSALDRGLRVSAEVAPHHLLLTDSLLETSDATAKVNPPLREAEDVAELRRALADGTVSCVATDHAPHSVEEKARGMATAPPGMIGMEFCLPLMMRLVEYGDLSLARLIDALTAAPAHLIGIDAPSIREGVRADLCLYDPGASYTLVASALHSKSTNTPFLGQTLQGRIELTIAAGIICFEHSRP